MPNESKALERESVTKKTHDLIEAFESAEERLRRIESERNRARCDRSNAEIALSKWLIPADAKEGEQYNVWYGNRIVSVVVAAGGKEGSISIRESRS